MEFHLALNTILYIMIFLFPGILFRKFRFIRHDFKQFDKGNLFERFLLTIFFSIVILVFSVFIFSFIKDTLKLNLLDSISYTTFKSIFETLSGNQLPDEDNLKEIYIDYIIILSAIYVLSIMLGIVTYFLSNKFFIKDLGIFKRHNYWHDLIMRDSKKENKHSNQFVLGYTQADVLVETNEKTKLYTGRIENYYLNPMGGLETLVISRVKRYKNNMTGYETKGIPGDAFIIDNNRIVNINLSYVYIKKEEKKFYKNIITVLDLFCIILMFCVGIAPFLSIVDKNISGVFMKILFVANGMFLISSINGISKKLILGNFKMESDSGLLLLISINIIMIIYTLGLINIWIMLLIITGFITFMALLIGKNNKDAKNSLND
ncbi:hypothetical protein MSHRCOH1_03460 [Candidatus Ornithobacterium hominis]|uniref:hypothetical protein n=1 Tax=Candidatus Ornithobacterium hominis TaxID=2497989 RepID=UPI0024BC7D8B|nr:hypothetical protein [Candidatus Ornithobacterium hominis]CAI9429246.1 hypothetical protein MSHRCOH1_03460 [Candidatus Ornithobacterium hominis]